MSFDRAYLIGHAGEVVACPDCGGDVMPCYGLGLALRREPPYLLDGDGIVRHVCDPQTRAITRALMVMASRQPEARATANDYVPEGQRRPAAARTAPVAPAAPRPVPAAAPPGLPPRRMRSAPYE